MRYSTWRRSDGSSPQASVRKASRSSIERSSAALKIRIFGSAIEGQNQIKAGSFAFAGRTDDFHRAAEFAYPPRDNRQSQSGSARLGRKKWLENFILH